MIKRLIIFPLILMILTIGCTDTSALEKRIDDLEKDNLLMRNCVLRMKNNVNHSHYVSWRESQVSGTIPGKEEEDLSLTEIQLFSDNGENCINYIMRIDERLGK